MGDDRRRVDRPALLHLDAAPDRHLTGAAGSKHSAGRSNHRNASKSALTALAVVDAGASVVDFSVDALTVAAAFAAKRARASVGW